MNRDFTCARWRPPTYGKLSRPAGSARSSTPHSSPCAARSDRPINRVGPTSQTVSRRHSPASTDMNVPQEPTPPDHSRQRRSRVVKSDDATHLGADAPDAKGIGLRRRQRVALSDDPRGRPIGDADRPAQKADFPFGGERQLFVMGRALILAPSLLSLMDRLRVCRQLCRRVRRPDPHNQRCRQHLHDHGREKGSTLPRRLRLHAHPRRKAHTAAGQQLSRVSTIMEFSLRAARFLPRWRPAGSVLIHFLWGGPGA